MRFVKHRDIMAPFSQTSRMQKAYSKAGIKQSFIRDIKYSGPHEVAWAVLAKRVVGRRFSKKLQSALMEEGISAEFEERPKKLKRAISKLGRTNKEGEGLEPSLSTKILLRIMGQPAPRGSFGSIRDWYGVRMVLAGNVSYDESMDKCYDAFRKVLDALKITDPSQILSVTDFLARPAARKSEEGRHLGHYYGLHLSIVYWGIPIEIQIRDKTMDEIAKGKVKRPGLD